MVHWTKPPVDDVAAAVAVASVVAVASFVVVAAAASALQEAD